MALGDYGGGNVSAARHRYPQGGPSPENIPWWQQLIWVIILLIVVIIIWWLIEGRKRGKR